MFKLVELELQVRDDGTVEIPIEALKQTDIHTGDTIRLIYMAEGEDSLVNATKEFLLTGKNQNAAELLQIDESTAFRIPEELLMDAGIPMDADLDIVCRDGKIIILPSGETETGNVIPEELMDIFRELGIPKEKVHVILHTAGEDEDGKTNL